jgi:hypothetical protein
MQHIILINRIELNELCKICPCVRRALGTNTVFKNVDTFRENLLCLGLLKIKFFVTVTVVN